MSTEIQIVRGDSAGGTLMHALGLKYGDWLNGRDLLSLGPLPPIQSLSDWLRIREDYWQGIQSKEIPWSGFGGWDLPVNGQRLSAADSVKLWIGSGLDDQLLLAFLVQFFRILNIDLAKLRVIQFQMSPHTRRNVESLAELNSDDLRGHPVPKELRVSDIKLLDAVWNAMTGSEPDTLVAFLQDRSYATRRYRRNLRQMIRRYPSASSGLSAWELKLLGNVAKHGPMCAGVIGNTMRAAYESHEEVTDVWLFPRLLRMGDDESLAYPLVTFKGDRTTLGGTKAYLTDIGRKVLAGKANFIELNGIDDWVGGVHLDSSNGRVWYRNGSTLVRA